MNTFTQTCKISPATAGVSQDMVCVTDATYLYYFLGINIVLLILIWLKK